MRGDVSYNMVCVCGISVLISLMFLPIAFEMHPYITIAFLAVSFIVTEAAIYIGLKKKWLSTFSDVGEAIIGKVCIYPCAMVGVALGSSLIYAFCALTKDIIENFDLQAFLVGLGEFSMLVGVAVGIFAIVFGIGWLNYKWSQSITRKRR